jgi:hypothetical protein
MNPGNPVNPNIPAGYGAFKLNVDRVTRTILPATPNFSNFENFELIFTPTALGELRTVRFNSTDVSGSSSPTYLLVVGTYNIILNAYNGEILDQNLAASGTLTGVTIAPGADENCSITLRALLANDQGKNLNGTFTYSASVAAANVTTATMLIKDDMDNVVTSITPNPRDISTAVNNLTITLPIGRYTIEFDLIKDNPPDNAGVPSGLTKERAIWNEVLYIYSALDSAKTFNFTDEYFHRTHYTVTFIFHDNHYYLDNNPSPRVYQSIPHDDNIARFDPNRLNDPERPGYQFGGWYLAEPAVVPYTITSNATTGNYPLWVFNGNTDRYALNTPVIKDIALHAVWVANSIKIDPISIDFLELIERGPTIADITLSRTGVAPNLAAQSVQITYGTALPVGASLVSAGWEIKGAGIHAEGGSCGCSPADHNAYLTGTSNTVPFNITLNATSPYYNSLGWHTVVVKIVVDYDYGATVEKREYQTNFRFQIVE